MNTKREGKNSFVPAGSMPYSPIGESPSPLHSFTFNVDPVKHIARCLLYLYHERGFTRSRFSPFSVPLLLTPLIQAMTRCTRARSYLSRLPSRATPARVLPRQEEIAAR